MVEEPEDSLADDYMYGFDTQNDLERKWLGIAAANGWAPAEDLKEFRRYSLLRGVEEWHQMLCCANTRRENSPPSDPLDGQDLLAFLSKIYLPCTTVSDKHAEEQKSPEPQRHSGHAAEKSQPTYLEKPSGSVGKKRKRRKSKGSTGLAPALKTHKRDKQSPYWSTPQAQLANEQPDQPADGAGDTRKSKSAKRRYRRSKLSERLSDPNSSAVHISGSNTVLREAASGCRNEDNVFAPQPVEHSGRVSKHASPEDGNTQDDEPNQEKTSSYKGEDECLTLKPSIRTAKSKSPYFNSPTVSSPTKAKSPRPPRNTVSSIPFPRLDAPRFGLIQEELANDPFRLLIAVTFLIRTPGKTAIPVFRRLMDRYPTPRDLAEADTADIGAMIKHLGLAVVRAAAIQKYARAWLENPPRADVRYGVKNYPRPGDGADVRAGEAFLDHPADPRAAAAWEIGHMTQGRYALDSWRIFCRDVLLGRADDWKGGGREGEFQPEWMRVRPEDKELRACLRWMWMREGWEWDSRTGEREVLSEDLRRAVDEGRVAYDDMGGLRILDE
ncbi:DNA glycosylase [Xylariaceae sp. FL0662B]|nr:DNA glycosylase [Xylariaceae sp. FL0662B]